METKSRYEVISDLEEQKRELIRERDGLQDSIKSKEYEIKKLKRLLEDKEEDLETFKDTLEERKATINELIATINEGLQRFSNLQKKE